MPAFPTTGSFPLTGVAKLPNIHCANEVGAERWSNWIAQEEIVPGSAIMPTTVSGKGAWRLAETGDEVDTMAIAARCPDIPDGAGDSIYTHSLGPNEIKNLPLKVGEYVLAYKSGVFHLTLIVPRAWAPGDLVGWDPDGARPTGKSGTGSWGVAGAGGNLDALFEVIEFRPFSSDGHEGLLTVRSLRSAA